MAPLAPTQRRALRARAHSLRPVVSVSQHGLSEAVLAEIDHSLKAHQLIKVRVYREDRDSREAILAEICARLEAAPVQHIGNILVVFRETPEAEKPAPAAKPAPKARAKPSKAGPKAAKAGPKSYFKSPAKPAAPRRRLGK